MIFKFLRNIIPWIRYITRSPIKRLGDACGCHLGNCECIAGVATCDEHDVDEEIDEFGVEGVSLEKEELLHCSDEVYPEDCYDIPESPYECFVCACMPDYEFCLHHEEKQREQNKAHWHLKRARLRQIAKANGVKLKRTNNVMVLYNGKETMFVEFNGDYRSELIGLIKWMGDRR